MCLEGGECFLIGHRRPEERCMAKSSFERTFGEVRSILQQVPLETVWYQDIEYNESPTWEQYRALDRALAQLVSIDPERARDEVDPYVAAQLEHSDWCMRPVPSFLSGAERIDPELAELLLQCFPSLFVLHVYELAELEDVAEQNPAHVIGLVLSATTLKDQKPFAAHPAVPRLTHLDMGYSRLREKNCELIASSVLFQGLTHLDLSNTQLRDEGLDILTTAHDFDGLHELSLAGTNVSSSGLRKLFKNLEAPLTSVDVSYIDHGRWQEPFIAICKNTAFSGLKSLRADVSEFRDESFEALGKATHITGLEVLSAGSGWFKTKAAASFVTSEVASGLRRLSLRSARIARAAFSALPEATFARTLHTLDLSAVKLKPWAVDALARTPFESLRTLDLEHCDLDDDALERLVSAPWFGGLEDLNLTGNRELGERGALALAHAPCSRTWRNLQLNGCEIGDVAFTELVRSQRMKTIVFLNVSYTGISRVGVRALIDATHIDRIRALYTTNTEVILTDDDREAMAKAPHFEDTYM